jgi:Zn finger protein HypA/HybF involved in hydrogenase expression
MIVDSLDLWANNNPNGNAAKQLKYNRERADLQEKRNTASRAEFACLCPKCSSDQVLVESPK